MRHCEQTGFECQSIVLSFNKNKIINLMFGSSSLASTKGFITHAHCAFRQMKPCCCISKWTYEPPHMVSNFIFIKTIDINLNKIKIKSALCSVVKQLGEETARRGLFEQTCLRVPQPMPSLDVIYTKQLDSVFYFI